MRSKAVRLSLTAITWIGLILTLVWYRYDWFFTPQMKRWTKIDVDAGISYITLPK